MYLARLRIQGFRGIREADLVFGTHTVLIGPNSSGKTTVTEALALLFGRDKLIRELTEHDFFGSNPQAADRIRIVATLSGFEGNDPDRHSAWFREDRAVPKWLNPADGVLHAAHGAGYALACQIGFSARFDRDELTVETIRYYHDNDEMGDVFDPDVVRRVQSSVIKELGFFLVPANRTWDRALSFGSELFRRVVAAIGGRPAQAVIIERDRLRRPEAPLEQDAGLREIVAHIDAELAGLFSRPPRLTLRLTATDSEAVLDAVMPHFVAPIGSDLPAKRHGSGLISLQQLLLLLHFGRLRAERGQGFMLALEEPELHVPPPIQRRLIHRIQALSTQTIVGTHSPVVASGCEPTSVLILQNRDGNLASRPLLDSALGREAPNWKRTLYGTKRQETITALMHDVVLVPEGRSDFDIFRLLVDVVELRRPAAAIAGPEFGALVGVVPTQDANVVGVFEGLARTHNSTFCLIDGDEDGDRYIAALTALASPPVKIFQWPVGWSVEDVIGWIVAVDAVVLPLVATALHLELLNVAALVAVLKRATNAGGLKGDPLVYEALIGIAADSPTCLRRIQLILERLAHGSLGGVEPTEGWIRTDSSTDRTLVCRFVP